MKYPVIDGIEYKRAELGIDGNCAFALLGPDIQAGEAEFVEIGQVTQKEFTITKQPTEVGAAKRALGKLRARLNMPELSYFLGRGFQ